MRRLLVNLAAIACTIAIASYVGPFYMQCWRTMKLPETAAPLLFAGLMILSGVFILFLCAISLFALLDMYHMSEAKSAEKRRRYALDRLSDLSIQ